MKPEFWNNRRVLVTGHTGFKGSWLCLWLQKLGACVSGLSLDIVGEPNLWSLIDLNDISHHLGDVRDPQMMDKVFSIEKPEIVFHMAAQSLVRQSYKDPIETFSTNVLGVVSLLHTISRSHGTRAAVIVTSDKCYDNNEQARRYVESDRMGGRDPYSSSKGCAELATSAMRASYFSPYCLNGHPCRIASARAGNVIGGGDWSEDRLVPDIIRGCLGESGQVALRAPGSMRPWQHVLEPLRGYLMLAERLFSDPVGIDCGWNFGPELSDERPVIDVAKALVFALGQGEILIDEDINGSHEAKILRLDSTKARELGWYPCLKFENSIELVAHWYSAFGSGSSARELCSRQIDEYMKMVEVGG